MRCGYPLNPIQMAPDSCWELQLPEVNYGLSYRFLSLLLLYDKLRLYLEEIIS